MELPALKVGKPRPTPVVRGGITAVFDYGENTLKKTMKFSGDGNSGIQKRPHIRTGHDRHLKNGKIVHVKGCVIHKDEYNGYLSADRVIS